MILPVTKEEIVRAIRAVPDTDDTGLINYWKRVSPRYIIYLEGWCDECITNWGYPDREETREDKGDWLINKELFRRLTPEILERKGKERDLKLVNGGFFPLPKANFLYGVTWGLYKESVAGASGISNPRRGYRRNIMMMLTKENLRNLPRLYSQEHVEDPIVWVKFFTPWTWWTWYAIEYDPKQRLFFGWVCGHEKELGYFSLGEFETVRGPGGLRIERDMHFTPMRLSEVKARHEKYGAANPRLRGREFEVYRGFRVFWDPKAKRYPYTAYKGSSYNKDMVSARGENIGVVRMQIDNYWMTKALLINPRGNPEIPPVYATPSNILEWAQPGLVMYSPRTREIMKPDITDIMGVPKRRKFLDTTGAPMILALKHSKRELIALNPRGYVAVGYFSRLGIAERAAAELRRAGIDYRGTVGKTETTKHIISVSQKDAVRARAILERLYVANPPGTVKEFYVGMGRIGDWKTRAKIEKAVMIDGKLHWKDIMDNRACKIIAEAKAN